MCYLKMYNWVTSITEMEENFGLQIKKYSLNP